MKSTAAGLAAAKSLERMVEARNTTVLMVGREILQRQQDAMQHGPAALAPMTMADLAEALGFHESTISRVVAGTSLDTPRGTWWLRQMFSPALGGNGAPRARAQPEHRGMVAPPQEREREQARELGPRGIHVAHSIIDGAIDTEFIRTTFPERYALKDQVGILRIPSSRTLEEASKCRDKLFLDFVRRCLELDPKKRWSASQALQHEWIKSLHKQ